ncbi:MAG: hypothetical protein JW776_14255 [Candidatus Lokiarchaeota archaeon]|nr:hypothetical protein [Candidatus Lokiarchaeota archaeon]
MTEESSTEPQKRKKFQIIKPSFYVDDARRVICESHSQIEKIRALSSLSDIPAFQETQQLEKILTCKTCLHYKNDTCYFPKEDIDNIERDRLSYRFSCKLCGGSIDRPLTIMYSLYNKKKYHVEIPTVCCNCFSSLEDDSFLSNTRRRIIFFTLSFLISIYLFFSYAMVFIASSIWGIILLAIALIFWGYMAVRDIRSILFLVRGRKYYKQTYGQAKRKEGQYVDEFPFD